MVENEMDACVNGFIHAILSLMKTLLTTLVAFALTLPVLGEFQVSSLPFYFLDPDSAFGKSLSATPITYEDGTPLVKNESFRALAFWWDGFDKGVALDGLPFELDASGNPIIVPEAEGAFCMWMETTTFGENDNGGYPKYAPVEDIPGIAGVTNTSLPTGAYTFSFSLNKYEVEARIPDTYKEKHYRVYLITQDTRNVDGTVAEGEPTNVVKWNATYVTLCEYNMYYIGSSFALNFEAPDNKIDVPSPTLDPYVEKPEIVFPDDTIKALEAALGEDAAAVTEITNPEVASIINGCGVELDGTVATFTYEFKVSEITADDETVTVTVSVGEGQTFTGAIAVCLESLDGEQTQSDSSVLSDDRTNVTATFSKGTGTQIFTVKAAKVDQTNEEGFEEE